MNRRELFRRSGAAAVRVSGAAALLAACGRAAKTPEPATRGTGPGRLPIFGDNPPIAPDLPIERGVTLRVYQWREYLYDEVLELFVQRYAPYRVDVEVESFTTMAEAMARLQQRDATFDVFFPTIEALPRLVGERLLRPLTHAYLTNLPNLWPFFLRPGGPFYDVGQRYSVPYTVYSTGIAWRRDLVDPEDAPDALANPYDVFWNARYRARVGIYDNYREALALALLHRRAGVNTHDAEMVRGAVDDLIAAARAVDLRVSADGAYEAFPAGELAVQQAWSGDVLSAKRFGSVGAAGGRAIDYVWPRGGVVGCDLTAICARGRSPVLAHAFVDHLLDERVAMENFSWNGYQPPIGAATPEAFADPSYLWASLASGYQRSAILAPGDLETGSFLRPLEPAVDTLWRAEWQRFLASSRPA